MGKNSYSDEDIERELNRLSQTEVNEDKINNALEEKEYVDRVSQKGKLAEVKDVIRDFFAILTHRTKFKVSAGEIAVITGAILYILTPIDLIPDIIPILGFSDDAAVVVAAAKMLDGLLRRYRKWKKENDITD